MHNSVTTLKAIVKCKWVGLLGHELHCNKAVSKKKTKEIRIRHGV